MYETSYVRPSTLAEAIDLLQENPDAKPLSGGMTLIPTMKQRLAAPSHVIDLARLSDLKGITARDGVVRVGAATVHAEVASSELVAATIPALAYLAGQIADPQVRNRGTIGGSVANNDPSADYPSAVLGLNATVITSERSITADDFFVAMFETALQPSEIVVAIEFPVPDQAGYAKCRHPASGYAVTGVFVARFGADVRVAVTGAGTSVFRWTEAEQRLAQNCTVEALRDLHIAADDLLEDSYAPRPYRANLVEVYTRRAVAAMLAGPK